MKRQYNKRMTGELVQIVEECEVMLIKLSLIMKARYRQLADTDEWREYVNIRSKYQYYKRKMNKAITAIGKREM